MTSEHVIAEPGAEGRVALKSFLEYAETGTLPERGYTSGKPPDSDFEIAVARVLENLGYQVQPQVGVAGYFIDIGVRHPHYPDEFILGVECDGAMYHSSVFARDRDRLREEVLKRRGWRIYRIWSTDWFRNRGPEIERLRSELEEVIQKSTATVAKAPEFAEPTLALPSATTPRLTDDELRARLEVYCRENIPRSEELQRADGFLQPVVLDALVTYRITSRSAFREHVPVRARASLDSHDLQYMDDIFEIIEQAS